LDAYLSQSSRPFSMTFFNQQYRTSTTGLEINIVVLCAFVLYISMLINKYKIRYMLPISIPYIIFIVIAIISALLSANEVFNPYADKETPYFLFTYNTGLYPKLELVKLILGYFVFFVTANFIYNNTNLNIVTNSIIIMICYLSFSALVARYVYGEFRVELMNSSNVFNGFIAMLGAYIVPFLYAEKSNTKKFLYTVLLTLTLVSIILTISRSSLAAYCLVAVIGGVISFIKYPTINNLAFSLMAMVFMSLAALKGWATLSDRFEEVNNLESYADARPLYNQEGTLMANDNLFGVGLGNFSAYSITKYAKLVSMDPLEDRGTLAHNIWFLTLGELGYPGLIAFIGIWLSCGIILVKSIFFSLRKKYSVYFLHSFACLLSFLALHFQNLYHYSYRDSHVYYLAQIILGLSVGIYLLIRHRMRFYQEDK